MAETITKTVTVNASGKAMAKFKAGADLQGKVNAAYFDTNEGGTDGEAYEYSLQFIIVEPIED
jgi:hypothetical protein